MHAHIQTGERAKQGWGHVAKAGLPMNTGKWRPDPDGMAEMYQSQNMMAVIFDVDGETRSGVKMDNGETANWMKKYPDTFIGFGSVDPWKGKIAEIEVKRCADMGLRGMKFQQAAQGFNPNDERFFPIYETIVRLNLPVIFHTGTTAVAAGSPGGKGITLEYCKPIPYIDNLAAWYPEMRIILAPPPAPLHDKAFFGTDFPMMTPERWLSEFAELPLKDSVRPKILLHNAAKFLGIEVPAAAPAH